MWLLRAFYGYGSLVNPRECHLCAAHAGTHGNLMRAPCLCVSCGYSSSVTGGIGIDARRKVSSISSLTACRYTQRPGRSARATKAVYFQ